MPNKNIGIQLHFLLRIRICLGLILHFRQFAIDLGEIKIKQKNPKANCKKEVVNFTLCIMVIGVVEFSREGYKIRKIFGQKSISSKEIILFCELTQWQIVKNWASF